MSIIPWSENIWFSPYHIIDELPKIIQSGDKKKIKRAKEAWVCAVAMICHTKSRSAEWWIQLPKNDPPDVLSMNVTPSNGGQSQDLGILEVEIFEISYFDKENIEKSIERKLNQKDYSTMTLIGFVRRAELFDYIKVADYIKNIKPKAFCIFILVCEKSFPNYSLIQIYPSPSRVTCDISIYLKAKNQNTFVSVSRSTKIKNENFTTIDTYTLIP